MSAWELRPKAQTDLEDISNYTAKTWGIAKASEYLEQINLMIERLCVDHWRGTAASTRFAIILKCRVGHHFIMFRRDAGRVIVVRILHERMDVDAQLN